MSASIEIRKRHGFYHDILEYRIDLTTKKKFTVESTLESTRGRAMLASFFLAVLFNIYIGYSIINIVLAEKYAVAIFLIVPYLLSLFFTFRLHSKDIRDWINRLYQPETLHSITINKYREFDVENLSAKELGSILEEVKHKIDELAVYLPYRNFTGESVRDGIEYAKLNHSKLYDQASRGIGKISRLEEELKVLKASLKDLKRDYKDYGAWYRRLESELSDIDHERDFVYTMSRFIQFDLLYIEEILNKNDKWCSENTKNLLFFQALSKNVSTKDTRRFIINLGHEDSLTTKYNCHYDGEFLQHLIDEYLKDVRQVGESGDIWQLGIDNPEFAEVLKNTILKVIEFDELYEKYRSKPRSDDDPTKDNGLVECDAEVLKADLQDKVSALSVKLWNAAQQIKLDEEVESAKIEASKELNKSTADLERVIRESNSSMNLFRALNKADDIANS